MQRRPRDDAASAAAQPAPLEVDSDAVVLVNVPVAAGTHQHCAIGGHGNESAAHVHTIQMIMHAPRGHGSAQSGMLVLTKDALLLADYSGSQARHAGPQLQSLFDQVIDQTERVLSVMVKVGKLKPSSWLWLEDVTSLLIVKTRSQPLKAIPLIKSLRLAIEAHEQEEAAAQASRAEAEEVAAEKRRLRPRRPAPARAAVGPGHRVRLADITTESREREMFATTRHDRLAGRTRPSHHRFSHDTRRFGSIQGTLCSCRDTLVLHQQIDAACARGARSRPTRGGESRPHTMAGLSCRESARAS